MKSVLVIAILVISSLGLANTKTGKCANKAEKYVTDFNGKILEDIGVIQGYEEALVIADYSEKTTYQDADYSEVEETYNFEISANNDEGDWWVSSYQVVVKASFNNDDEKKPYCDVESFNYLGVTESGGPNNQED